MQPKRFRATEPTANDASAPGIRFPLAAGLLLGLGVGGFFDGIVLHQILQWHHMLSSAGYPPDTLENLRTNTLADGLFHVATYGFVLWGLARLWRASRQTHFHWSAGLLAASMLMGFGAFNLVEGLVNHQLLGIHHVNETVPTAQWVYWDIGFLVWGLAMLVGGWAWYARSIAAALPVPRVPPVPAALPMPLPVHASVAGEEDPGAALDTSGDAPRAGELNRL